MPYRRKATEKDLDMFVMFSRVTVSLKEIKEHMANGEELIFEASSFEDPGEDWTALYLNDRRIAFWPGH